MNNTTERKDFSFCYDALNGVQGAYSKKALILKSALIAKILKSELLQCPSMVNTLGLLGPLQ